jgi:hypothetical protein
MLSLSTLRRHIGKTEVLLHSFTTSARDSRLTTQPLNPKQEGTPGTIEKEAGWASQPVWAFPWNENPLAPTYRTCGLTAHTHTHTHTHTHAYTHARTHTRIHTRTRIHTHTHARAYTRAHAYTHTYTHTRFNLRPQYNRRFSRNSQVTSAITCRSLTPNFAQMGQYKFTYDPN